MLDEELARPVELVARQIERDDRVTLREQCVEFHEARFRPERAAQDADQLRAHAGRAPPVLDAGDHRFDDRVRVEGEIACHVHRAEAQFDIIESLALRVLDVFARDAAARVGVGEYRGHPVGAGKECERVAERAVDLDDRPERLEGRRRKRDAVLLRQRQDRGQPHVAVEVTMQVDTRKRGVEHHVELPMPCRPSFGPFARVCAVERFAA